VESNIDRRLLSRWRETQRRQKRARAILATLSPASERFDSWALDVIASSLAGTGTDRDPTPAPPTAPRPARSEPVVALAQFRSLRPG
jgi:hypothetical protein